MIYLYMAFLNLFKRHAKSKESQQDQIYLALDIGTEVLKGLLFKITDLGVEIIASNYKKQPLVAMQAGRVIDIDSVIKGADSVIEELFKDIDKPRIPNITTIFGIAGELINGVAVSAHINRGRNSESIISENEERTILDQLFDYIIEGGKQELAESLDISPAEVVVLNVSINGMYIDGLVADRLVGNKGSRVSAFLYASFAPLNIIKKLSEVSKGLRIKLAGIVVQPYAVARSFGIISDPTFSGMFIDIGGGTTDIALVLDGFNIQTKMVAFGGRAFTNRLVQKFGLDYNLAEERKIKYSSGLLPSDITRQTREALQEDVRLWVDTVRIALQKMEGVKTFPDTIYLCGGGAMLPDIQSVLSSYPWQQFLPFNKHPKVLLTNPSKQDRVYDRTGKLQYPYDVTPVALARYLYDIIRNPKYNYVGFEHES